jgi:hypothetical protein
MRLNKKWKEAEQRDHRSRVGETRRESADKPESERRTSKGASWYVACEDCGELA